MILPRQALRSLRHRNYKIYFTGQLLSLTGSWVQNVALSWLVYRLSGSPALLGLVSFAEQIPAFLLAPLTGVACDRLASKLRSTIIISQLALTAHALALAYLTASGRTQVWHVFVLAVMMGVINAFDLPARQTILASLVERKDMPNAIALNSSLYNGARVAGPALAGLLIGAFGESTCFLINAISFIPMVAGLCLMRIIPERNQGSDGGTSVAGLPSMSVSFLDSFRQGVSYAIGNESIRRTLALVFCTCFFGFSFLILMPAFVAKVYGGDARLLGFLMSMTGLGAVVGSLVLASRQGSQGFERLIAFSSFGFALLTLAFSFAGKLWLGMPLLVAAGFFMVSQMAASNTLIQTQAPPALRGRLLSLYSMGHTGMSPLGALLAGQMASRFGAPATVGLSSLLFLGVASWYTLGVMGPVANRNPAVKSA